MKIQGQVTDKKTGEPIPFANVYFSFSNGKINSERQGTTTNEFGRYKFEWPADLWITASFVGYKSQTKPIPRDYSDNAVLNFELEAAATELPGVTITAKPIKKTSKILVYGGILALILIVWYFATKR